MAMSEAHWHWGNINTSPQISVTVSKINILLTASCICSPIKSILVDVCARFIPVAQ